MNRLKKIWRSLLRSKKKRLVLVSGFILAVVLGVGLYYGIALACVSEAEVNLAALKEGVNKEKICHEDCLALRKKQEAIVLAGIKKPEPNLLKRLDNYWQDPKESLEFKEEIINLWRFDDDPVNLPKYFSDYLDQADGDVKLQALIISSFLAVSPDTRLIDYYFSLLSSDRAKSLKKEAIIALSNRSDKADSFTLKQLGFLKDLIMDSKTPSEIKPDLVSLGGDYYSLYPVDAYSALLEIYNDKSIDNISRAFAADILNRNNEKTKGFKVLLAPEISGEEWQAYYNN